MSASPKPETTKPDLAGLFMNGGCLLLALELRRLFGLRVVVLMRPYGLDEIGDHFELGELLRLAESHSPEEAVRKHTSAAKRPSDWKAESFLSFLKTPRPQGLLSYHHLRDEGLLGLGDWGVYHAWVVRDDGRALDIRGWRSEEEMIAGCIEDVEESPPRSLWALRELRDDETMDVAAACDLSEKRLAEIGDGLEAAIQKMKSGM